MASQFTRTAKQPRLLVWRVFKPVVMRASLRLERLNGANARLPND